MSPTVQAAPYIFSCTDQITFRPKQRVVGTIIEWHLGDNLIHLHFLRSLAAANPDVQFLHAAQEEYLWQLAEMVADVPNIKLISLAAALQIPDFTWLHAWKNADSYFVKHPGWWAFCEFHLDWFAHLSQRMGFRSPFSRNEDLIFDYPALLRASDRFPSLGDFDFLFINSCPRSGQLSAYNSLEYLDPLLTEIINAGHSVVVTQPTSVQKLAGDKGKGRILCTQDYGMSVTDIGRVSRHCRHHIMVSTGPSWPVLNKWNLPSGNLRVLFLEHERLNYPSVIHVPNRERCRELLVERKLL